MTDPAQTLLACQAVAFLYGNSQYQTDAVHFGIALAYYGLLRVPTREETSDVDIRASRSYRCTACAHC